MRLLRRLFEPVRLRRIEGYDGPGTWRHREEALLAYPPSVVWSLVGPAEHSSFLETDVVKGWHVPGTPAGLGEQQALEDVSGAISVFEVVDYEHERRVVTRQVSPILDHEQWAITEVEPQATGCVLAFSIEIEVPPARVLLAADQELIRDDINAYVWRVAASIGPWVASRDEP